GWAPAKVPEPDRVGQAPAAVEETVFTVRRTTEPPVETAADSVLGTPAYMAPEQARGDLANLDLRADVFGLGSILCVILTGGPPFPPPDSLEKAARADLGDALVRLERCGADPELIDLARRCLAPRKEDRPADGAAVARVVAAY